MVMCRNSPFPEVFPSLLCSARRRRGVSWTDSQGSRLEALLEPDGAEGRLASHGVDMGGEDEFVKRVKREEQWKQWKWYLPMCPFIPRCGGLADEVVVNVAVIVDHLAVRRYNGSAERAEAKVRQIIREGEAYYRLRTMPIPYRFRIAQLSILKEPVEDALVDGKYHWGKLLRSKMAKDILKKGLQDDSVHSVAFFVGAEPATEVVEDYKGTRGLALSQEMCTEKSVSMTRVNLEGGDPTAATFAHEIGHILGMNHDGPGEWNGPGCSGTPVQMMGGSGTMGIASWSPCSVQQAERWFGCWGCLHKDPKGMCVDKERGCAHYGSPLCVENSANTAKNTTMDGTPCQPWADDTPHKHGWPSQAPYGNQCRLADSSDKAPWCYTMNPDKKWDYCWPPCEAEQPIIESCVKADGSCAMFRHDLCRSNDGVPQKNTTRAGTVCQAWAEQTPHEHGWPSNAPFGNNCRADAKTSAPWCYTTDPWKRWDYCWDDCVGVYYGAKGDDET